MAWQNIMGCAENRFNLVNVEIILTCSNLFDLVKACKLSVEAKLPRIGVSWFLLNMGIVWIEICGPLVFADQHNYHLLRNNRLTLTHIWKLEWFSCHLTKVKMSDICFKEHQINPNPRIAISQYCHNYRKKTERYSKQ